jgi:hypothetical protein
MKNNKDLYKKFNLPTYIKGKSFADASKAIKKKFEGRNDRASKETEQALMQRLADMQEHIKAEQAPPQQYQQPNQQMQPGMDQMAQQPMQQGQQPMQMDPTQMQMGQRQMFLGGLLGGEKGAGFMEASGQAAGKAGPGAYLQGAETVFNSANDIFGKTGIDTSGATGNLKRHDTVGATAGATLKGASAGAQIGGPLGAAIGGAVGLTGGIIGGKRKNDDIKEANQNFDIASVNKPLNAFALGGGMMGPGDKIKTKNDGKEEVTDDNLSFLNEKTGMGFDRETANRLFYRNSENNMSDLNMGKYKDSNYFNVNKQTDGNMYNINPTSSNPQNAQGYADQMNEIKKLNPNAKFTDNGYQDFQNRKAMGGYQNQLADGLDGRKAPLVGPGAAFGVLDRLEGGFNSLQSLNNNIDSKVGTDKIPQSFVDKTTKANNAVNKDRNKNVDPSFWDKAGKFAKNNGDLLRATPLLTDAIQLRNLNKDGYDKVSYQNVDSKYDPQLIDESRIQRDILANQGNTSRSLQNVAGGSKGFVAANMAGSAVNAAKGIAQGAVSSQAQNNAQLQYGQQFDRQGDQFNIGMNTQAQKDEAANKGVFLSNKSKLIDSIGDNASKLGDEELYKQFPERLGLKFNSKGETMINGKAYTKEEIDNLTPDEKAAIIKEKEKRQSQNQNAMGGYQSSFTSHMDYLKQ